MPYNNNTTFVVTQGASCGHPGLQGGSNELFIHLSGWYQ